MSHKRDSSSDSIEHVPQYDDVPAEAPSLQRDSELGQTPRYTEAAAPSARYTSTKKDEEMRTLPLPSHPQQGGGAYSAPPPPSGGGGGGGGRETVMVKRQDQFDFNMKPASAVARAEVNIDHRDEFHLNDGVNVPFFEAFGEPHPDLHSVACLWTNSYRIFDIVRIYWYKILTLVFGFIFAFLGGLLFATVAFLRIWLIRPLLRLSQSLMQPLIAMVQMLALVILRPIFYAIGGMFSSIRFHTSRGEVLTETWMNRERV